MATKFIDLSGRKGLANRFQGNLNDTASAPQRIYLAEDGQIADGIFNPLKNYGYLSPANNKYAAITGSINSRIISTEYDSINDDVYLAEAGNTIWRLDGLTDTSLTAAVVIDQSATESITDLEIYEINGKRNLFFAYNITDGPSYYSKIGTVGLDSDSGVYEIRNYDDDNTTIIDSVVASGTYTKLAQLVTPDQTQVPITGNVDAAASTTVTGVGTLFTTELAVGDTIVVQEEKRVVTAIASDTSLTVDTAFHNTSNDTSIKKIPAIRFDRVALPLNRPSGDNGGYTIQVSIQDASNLNRASLAPGGVLSAVPYIEDSNQTGLDLSDDFSIEGWVKFTDTSDNVYIVSKAGFTGSAIQYAFYYNNAPALNLTLYDGGQRYAQVSWTPVVDTWYHIAVTRAKAANEVKFYVNGAQQGATQTISTLSVTNQDYRFSVGGAFGASTGSGTVNLVDDVRVWSDVRTSVEISGNMSSELVGNESNLVGYWKLNNSTVDETSNNNHLTSDGVVTYADGINDEANVPFNAGGQPDGSADATGTVNPTTLTTAVFGSTEKQAMTYFTLDATVSKSQPFYIVVEPTVFANMTASDKFNWFGRTSNPDLSGQAKHYNGSSWPNTNASTDDKEDFSYALLLSTDQEWSNKRVTNPYNFKYNADVFMCKADNSFMYVFEDNKVHKVDGTETGGASGTFTKTVLRFPSYFTTVDAVDTRGRMYIGVQANPSSGDEDTRAYSEGIVGVYTWDRQSAVVGTRDFIPLYGVRDIKKLYVDPATGDVRAICIGDDKFVQIRSISSGAGKVLETLGISAYPETRDSLKYINGMATWLGADGIWYLHGRISPQDSEELFKIGTIAAEVTGAFTTGAIFVGDSNANPRQAVLASWTDATPGSEIMRWYPHGQGTISSVAQLACQGDVYTTVVPLPPMSTVKHIDINCFPTASSGATVIANVKVYFNQSTTPFKTHQVTQAMAAKGYVAIELNKPFVSSVQIEIEYSTSQTLGTDDFNPMFATIEYDPPADTVR